MSRILSIRGLQTAALVLAGVLCAFASSTISEAHADEGSIQVDVKPGDTLQKISDRYYGTTRRWKEIQVWNAARLRNSNALEVGTKITLLGVNSKPEATPAVVKAEAAPVVAESTKVFSAQDPSTDAENKAPQVVEFADQKPFEAPAVVPVVVAEPESRAPASIEEPLDNAKSLESVRDFVL